MCVHAVHAAQECIPSIHKHRIHVYAVRALHGMHIILCITLVCMSPVLQVALHMQPKELECMCWTYVIVKTNVLCTVCRWHAVVRNSKIALIIYKGFLQPSK